MVNRKFIEEDTVKVNFWEGFQILVEREMAICFKEREEHEQKQGVGRSVG